MMSARVKATIALLAMCVAAAAAHVGKPTKRVADLGPKVNLEAIFPASFGKWQIDPHTPVVLPSPQVQAALDKIYNAVLSRTYINDRGERIMLSVAYGGDQSDGSEAHQPEVCYPAQGFQVLKKYTNTLSVASTPLPVRRVVTRMGPRFEPVTYWIVVGEQVALSGSQQKLAQLRYGVQGLIPDGMLVRVSSISPEEQTAYRLQDRFVDEMYAAISAQQRTRVFGRVAASAS